MGLLTFTECATAWANKISDKIHLNSDFIKKKKKKTTTESWARQGKLCVLLEAMWLALENILKEVKKIQASKTQKETQEKQIQANSNTSST